MSINEPRVLSQQPTGTRAAAGVGTWLCSLNSQVQCTPKAIAVPSALAEILPLLNDGTVSYWRSSFQLVFGADEPSEDRVKAIMKRHGGLQRCDAFLRQAVKSYREEEALKQQVYASGAFGAAVRAALDRRRTVRRTYQEQREQIITEYRTRLGNLEREENANLPHHPVLDAYFTESERSVEEVAPAAYYQLIIDEIDGTITAAQFKVRATALKTQYMESWVRTNVSDANITEVGAYVRQHLN